METRRARRLRYAAALNRFGALQRERRKTAERRARAQTVSVVFR